ncbi:hypothetical protein [Sphingomonas sp.]|uniref:hypothetical protein n=1 Tax=Sphingomonas sp. TaxID=28214 RepID=UPI002DBD9CFB|nr:hypothetical protein [Sphingomonas sp.]HEU4967901.1 hypothetical protein [Sphingomonas sp.]
MADEDQARVYGMADPANRDPPPAEGMRGAKAETGADNEALDFRHNVTLDDGRTVTVSEGSGVAFAEETGRAGLAEAKPWRDTRVRDEESPVPLLPILAVAAAAGIIAFAFWRFRAHDVEAEIDFRPAPDL